MEEKLAASEQKKALLEEQVKGAKVGREDSVSDGVEIMRCCPVIDQHNVHRMSGCSC